MAAPATSPARRGREKSEHFPCRTAGMVSWTGRKQTPSAKDDKEAGASVPDDALQLPPNLSFVLNFPYSTNKPLIR